MADTYTPKLGLRKPATQATVDVGVLNDNYDLIDSRDLSKFGDVSTSGDWNILTKPGVYHVTGSNHSNSPDDLTYVGIVLSSDKPDELTQIVSHISNGTTDRVFMRSKGGLEWGDWKNIYDDRGPEVHSVGSSGEPKFKNSWINYASGFGPASFYKKSGIVYLSGVVKGGTISGTSAQGSAFILPLGFRPVESLMFPVATTRGSGVTATCTVANDGYVVITSGDPAYVSLSGIIFSVGS